MRPEQQAGLDRKTIDMQMWLGRYSIILLISFCLAFLLTPLIRFISLKIGAVDEPNERKLHTKPTPRLGGIGIYIAYSLALLYAVKLSNQQIGVLIGGFIVLLIGFIDDLKGLPATAKLLALILVALVLSSYGVSLDLFKNHYINLILTILWIVGVISAINAIDNMDGLASGLSFIASTSYLAVALQTEQWEWGALAAALTGATLGFLKFNFAPASIFMGDSGSFFLGFTLASLGIMGGWSTNPVKASIIPILILGVPIFDLIYTVIVRHREGITKNIRDIITFSGKDHISHRLAALGLSHKNAVLFIYMVSICVSVGAIVLRNASKLDAILLLGQFILIFIIVAILMNLVKKK